MYPNGYRIIIRSSHPEVFYEIGVQRNFEKLTGKHLCQSLFFKKVAGLYLQVIKKETLELVCYCEFCKIFKNTSFYRTSSDGCLCTV